MTRWALCREGEPVRVLDHEPAAEVERRGAEAVVPLADPGGEGMLRWSRARGLYREMTAAERAALGERVLLANALRLSARDLGRAEDEARLAAEVAALRAWLAT